MTGKEFFLSESIGWKMVYAIGFILIIIHISITLSIGNHNYRLLPLFGFSALASYFFRFARAKKNRDKE